MGEIAEQPTRHEHEDAVFLLRALWPLVLRESPAPFLRLEGQARAWAISLADTRASGCLCLSCASFSLGMLTGWWPLGIASLGLSLAGTYHSRRARALRLHWQRPRFWPLALGPADDLAPAHPVPFTGEA